MNNKHETASRRATYVKPEIESLSAHQVIEMLGPAVAIYGDPSNNNDPLWG
jgi:hypothetical protein